MSKRPPEARYVESTGIVVHRTHCIDTATELATRLVREADIDVGELPAPVRTWLRTRPASPFEREAYGFAFWYDRPKTVGERGSFAAVEFPSRWAMGLPASAPTDAMAAAARDALAPTVTALQEAVIELYAAMIRVGNLTEHVPNTKGR